MPCLRNQNYESKVLVKLFDTLIKPIILYESEVWGGFGIKGSASANTAALLIQCLKSDKTDYEKLNNKM